MSKILKVIWEFVSPFFADGFVSAVIIIVFLFLFCGFCVFIKEKLEKILNNRKVSEKKTSRLSKPQISVQISNTNNTEIKTKEPVKTKEFQKPKEPETFKHKVSSDFAEEDILRITKTHTLVFAEQKIDESDIGSSDIECQALCDCDYNPMNDDSIEEIDVTVTADSSWAETMDKYREEKVETEYEVKKEILL